MKRVIRRVFNKLSSIAVITRVNQDPDLKKFWQRSNEILPDLRDHYATDRMSSEEALRARLLISSQAYFLSEVMDELEQQGENFSTYADIGDSDGSVRLVLGDELRQNGVSTLGVNIQEEAVAQMREAGLEALCADAMTLAERQVTFDLVSVFETLEHLPNPIGFLEEMREITSSRLIISVPLIRKSRVSLSYLSPKWDPNKRATIANNHVFELSPEDWEKLFKHSGWRIEYERRVKQFPNRGILRAVMQWAWRKLSFEGYWLVCLKPDDTYKSRYTFG